MIFGTPTQSERLPFQRPRPANPNLMPNLLRTRFATHLNPYGNILPAASSLRPGTFPGGSGYMRPGVVPGRPVPAPEPVPAAAAGAFGRPTMYTGMRTGMDFLFPQTSGNIRNRAARAGAVIRQIISPQYPYHAVPAGYFDPNRSY